MLEEGLSGTRLSGLRGICFCAAAALRGVHFREQSPRDRLRYDTELRATRGARRFLSADTLRNLAKLVDQFGDGRLRWTTAGSVEFSEGAIV